MHPGEGGQAKWTSNDFIVWHVCKHKGTSSVWVDNMQCLGSVAPSHPRAPPALRRLAAASGRQPVSTKQRPWVVIRILIMCYCGDAQRTFMVNYWITVWGNDKSTFLVILYHCTVREVVCAFLKQELQVSSTPKLEETTLFYLYTCLFLDEVKGWFCPHYNLGQYWKLSFLRSHLICPNASYSVDNLPKWCLGTLPCSPCSLCD